MNQLTIRGFDKDIEREIRKIADRENISLNKAVLYLLRCGIRSAGSYQGKSLIGATLDYLAGKWSDDDLRAMNEVEKDFEHIDPELRS